MRWSTLLLSVLALAEITVCSTEVESDEPDLVYVPEDESEVPSVLAQEPDGSNAPTEDVEVSAPALEEVDFPEIPTEGSQIPITTEETENPEEAGEFEEVQESEIDKTGETAPEVPEEINLDPATQESEPEYISFLEPFDATAHSAYGLTSTGERVLDIIPVVRDGRTCPSDTKAASANLWNGIPQCEYGLYSAPIPDAYQSTEEWQCCYSEYGAFILSVPGDISQSFPIQDTQYILDEAPCCRSPTEQDAIFDSSRQQCLHGKAVLNIPDPTSLTTCCWDEESNNWSIHMKQPWPGKTLIINKEWAQDIGAGRASLDVKHANVYGHHLDILVQGVLGDLFDESRTVQVAFSHKWTLVTRFEVRVPILFSTLYIDVESVVNEDSTVSFRAHWTGTKILGSLDESTFILKLDSPDFKELMETYPAC